MLPEGIETHRMPGASVAVFTFGSYVNRAETAPSYAFMQTCLKVKETCPVPFDICYFLSNANDWYLSGVRHLGEGLEGAVPHLREFMQGYERTVFMGNSMGGYAAAALGALAGASKVVAISPQTRFDADFHAAIQETRWPKSFNQMRQRYDVSQYRLASLVERADSQPNIHLHAGAACPQDDAYADDAGGSQGVTVHKVVESGHDLAHDLKKSGRLEALVKEAIAGSL
jgi:pimeloyl-ACP methyl ester carboxylesterase